MIDYKPLKIQSFVAVLFLTETPSDAPTSTVVHSDRAEEWVALGHGSVRLWFRPRQLPARDDLVSAATSRILLLGGAAEWTAARCLTCRVYATPGGSGDSA